MLQIVIIVLLLIFIYLLIFRYKAPWVPILKKDLKRLEELVELKENKNFYDLGCGNGRVIFYLAKKYPQVNFGGIEISLFFFTFCWLRKITGNYKNVSLKLADYMRLDLNQADYLFVFSNTKPMQQLAKKLEKEIKGRIVLLSYCFEVFTWQKYLFEKSKPDLKDNLTIFFFY